MASSTEQPLSVGEWTVIPMEKERQRLMVNLGVFIVFSFSDTRL